MHVHVHVCVCVCVCVYVCVCVWYYSYSVCVDLCVKIDGLISFDSVEPKIKTEINTDSCTSTLPTHARAHKQLAASRWFDLIRWLMWPAT